MTTQDETGLRAAIQSIVDIIDRECEQGMMGPEGCGLANELRAALAANPAPAGLDVETAVLAAFHEHGWTVRDVGGGWVSLRRVARRVRLRLAGEVEK